jgi:hypothetical protein
VQQKPGHYPQAMLRVGQRVQSPIAPNTGMPSSPTGFIKSGEVQRQMPQPPILRPTITPKLLPGSRRIATPAIQRSAKRTAFWSETQDDIEIGSGEHRRHIIPNSLMKDAINNWNAVHKKWSGSVAQEWLDKLNNYYPNLIPGGGVANMASGGIMHQGHKIEGKISSLSDMTAISSTITTDFPKVSAFGGTGLAKQLVGEVIPTVSSFTTPEAMKEFASDMGHSGGFDWPTPSSSAQASELFQTWLSVYNEFLYMRDHPEGMSEYSVFALFTKFLTLPAPTTHH